MCIFCTSMTLKINWLNLCSFDTILEILYVVAKSVSFIFILINVFTHECFKHMFRNNSNKIHFRLFFQKANESKLIPTSHQYVNGSRFLIKVLFLLGEVSKSDISTDLQTNINYESDMNGDIIQESFLDSYNNLTLKSILMLKWVKNNCMTKGESYFDN